MEEREKEVLIEVYKMEDLAEKKANIYSRLLIDMDKAQEMERLAAMHKQAKKELEILLYGKRKKEKMA